VQGGTKRRRKDSRGDLVFEGGNTNANNTTLGRNSTRNSARNSTRNSTRNAQTDNIDFGKPVFNPCYWPARFKLYAQRLFSLQYDDLESFCGSMLPAKQMTQSSYVIGHLITGDISGFQLLLLILRELLIKGGIVMQNAQNGVDDALGSLNYSSSAGRSIGNSKTAGASMTSAAEDGETRSMAFAMMPVIYYLTHDHEKNRIILLTYSTTQKQYIPCILSST
jgi:hypothetical protein